MVQNSDEGSYQNDKGSRIWYIKFRMKKENYWQKDLEQVAKYSNTIKVFNIHFSHYGHPAYFLFNTNF